MGLTAIDKFLSDLEHLQKSNENDSLLQNTLYSAQKKTPPSITALSFICSWNPLVPLRNLGQADWRALLWPVSEARELQADSSVGFRYPATHLLKRWDVGRWILGH